MSGPRGRTAVAAMADLAEVVTDGHDLDLAIPSVFVWKSDHPGKSPIRVPELTAQGNDGLLIRDRRGERGHDAGVAEPRTSDGSPLSDPDALLVERMELETELPELRDRLAALRSELAGLRQEIRTAKQERDEAGVVTTALREQIAELSADASERERERDWECLPTLGRESEARTDRESDQWRSLSLLRIPTELLRFGSRGQRRFDDS